MSFHDTKSNLKLFDAIPAKSYTAQTKTSSTTALDCTLYESFTAIISAGTAFPTSGTLDAKWRYSTDGGSTYNDEPGTNNGNDASITQLTALGTAQMSIANPVVGATNYLVSVTNVGTIVYSVAIVAKSKTVPA